MNPSTGKGDSVGNHDAISVPWPAVVRPFRTTNHVPAKPPIHEILDGTEGGLNDPAMLHMQRMQEHGAGDGSLADRLGIDDRVHGRRAPDPRALRATGRRPPGNASAPFPRSLSAGVGLPILYGGRARYIPKHEAKLTTSAGLRDGVRLVHAGGVASPVGVR